MHFLNSINNDTFLNIDKSPNKKAYLFFIYLGLFVFIHAVNFVFFQFDTKFLHVEYLHLVVEHFPINFFSYWSRGLMPAEFLVLFIHNFSINLLHMLLDTSFETSLLYANFLYSIILMWAVDYTASKIHESYFFRISAVFIFMTIPGNISGMRLETIHYPEMVWLCVACAIFISFFIKPSFLKAITLSIVLSGMIALYRSGIMYALIVLVFFVFFVFFVDRPLWRKLLYVISFLFLFEFMIYEIFIRFFSVENTFSEICFSQTAGVLQSKGLYDFFLMEYLRLKNFILHFHRVFAMQVYSWFMLSVFLLVLIFRTYKFFPKKNIIFYMLLFVLFISSGSVIALGGIGIDGVSYPVYIFLYWFFVMGIYSFKSLSRTLYVVMLMSLFFVGFWMLLGSTMQGAYNNDFYVAPGYKDPINNLVKYRPCRDNVKLLNILRYYLNSFSKKEGRKPVVAFVKAKEYSRPVISRMLPYLVARGEIKFKTDFKLRDADIVIIPFSKQEEMYSFAISRYNKDNLEGYQEFRDKYSLKVLGEIAAKYFPENISGYKIKTVFFSPYGLDQNELSTKFYFLLEK